MLRGTEPPLFFQKRNGQVLKLWTLIRQEENSQRGSQNARLVRSVAPSGDEIHYLADCPINRGAAEDVTSKYQPINDSQSRRIPETTQEVGCCRHETPNFVAGQAIALTKLPRRRAESLHPFRRIPGPETGLAPMHLEQQNRRASALF